MRASIIILLVATALYGLLFLSENNNTLRRGLFFTAWKAAEWYERAVPTKLYLHLSPRTRAFYRLYFLNKPRYNTIEESRANALRGEGLIHPRDGVKFYHSAIKNVSVYWFEPKEYKPNNVIMYIHGGAFLIGSALAEAYAAGELAHRYGQYQSFTVDINKLRAKARVVSVNYRLLPEATLEEAIEDVLIVYRYILDEMNIKPTNVIPFGCSAGGMLTLLTMQTIKMRHKDIPLPVAGVTLAPGIPFREWESIHIPPEENIVLSRELGALVKRHVYRTHDSQTNQFLENKNTNTAKELLRDFAGLPPLYMSSGELDVLRDGVVHFAHLLKKQNVTVEFNIKKRMIHCAATMSQFIEEGHEELEQIAQWMNDKFNN